MLFIFAFLLLCTTFFLVAEQVAEAGLGPSNERAPKTLAGTGRSDDRAWQWLSCCSRSGGTPGPRLSGYCLSPLSFFSPFERGRPEESGRRLGPDRAKTGQQAAMRMRGLEPPRVRRGWRVVAGSGFAARFSGFAPLGYAGCFRGVCGLIADSRGQPRRPGAGLNARRSTSASPRLPGRVERSRRRVRALDIRFGRPAQASQRPRLPLPAATRRVPSRTQCAGP